tara:strand:- start:2587 stop:2697 length:111 start_codon:yes stop_codon:yes gene_type:complete
MGVNSTLETCPELAEGGVAIKWQGCVILISDCCISI